MKCPERGQELTSHRDRTLVTYHLLQTEKNNRPLHSLNFHSCLHMGQRCWACCELSHFMMQWMWKQWVHWRGQCLMKEFEDCKCRKVTILLIYLHYSIIFLKYIFV